MTSLLNKILLIILLSLQVIVSGQVLDKDGIPNAPSPPRLINDFAEILSVPNKQSLEDKLLAFNDSTSTQISIVTVTTIGDYSIEDYAVRLGRKWQIGQKGKNNGILILVAKDDRKIDIEIGYGLESYVTDYDSKHIIDELILPAFKQSNYYKGLDDATNRLIAQLQGTYTADKRNDNNKWTILTIIIIVLLILIILSFFTSKTGGYSSTNTDSSGGWIWTTGGGSSSWSGGGNSSSFGGFGGGSFGGGGSSGSW